MIKLIILIFSLVVLIGCQQDTREIDQKIDVEIVISINKGEDVIATKQSTVDQGTLLLDYLEENFDIQKSNDGFITAIEGYEQHDNYYWVYEVNEEPVFVGAGDYQLMPNDLIVFDLQEWN